MVTRAAYATGGSAALLVLGLMVWWFWPAGPKEDGSLSVDRPSPGIQATSPVQAVAGASADTLMKSAAFERDISLGHWLSQFDLSGERSRAIQSEFAQIVGVDSLRAGHDYQVFAEKTNPRQISRIIYETSPYDYLVWGMGDSAYFHYVARKRETHIGTVHGVIQKDLLSSFDKNKLSIEILANLEQALAWKVDFFHMAAGDAYTLVFDEYYADGTRVETGKLLAARVRTQGKSHTCYLFKEAARPGYFDEQGRPVRSSFLRSPLKYSRISSHYGMRKHPIDETHKQHRGTDYAAVAGTEIHAVADGRITAAAFNLLNGNFVRIDHGSGFETIYLHLRDFAAGLQSGDQVQQDQVIGYVGSTGKSTGPHLCFNLKKNGEFVDFLKADLPQAEPLPPAEIHRFQEVRDSLDSLLQQR